MEKTSLELAEFEIAAKGLLQKSSRGGSSVFRASASCAQDARAHLELHPPRDQNEVGSACLYFDFVVEAKT